MKPLTSEWVAKAEGDFSTARRELRARRHPNYDAACFHAQQCAEKYLKARLQEASIRFGRTHDLSTLLDLVLPVEPSWTILRPHALHLNQFAAQFRYPGLFAAKGDAREAVSRCGEIRRVVRASLGLPD
jgi:HEPN domain-containing protein